ncbi:MAG TPA: FecR domain-containing protein [Puia sp.]|nr:FecR domain-containing protein [Puia sp.]
MDPQSPYNDLPWDLIVSALQGELSPEEALLFQQWLASSADNRGTYERLQGLWKEGMTDYVFYRQANADGAWKELQQRMVGDGGRNLQEGGKRAEEEADEIEARVDEISEGAARGKNRVLMMKWAAVAAVVLLLVGGEWWYVSQRGQQYATAEGEVRQVPLPDGSTVGMSEQTQIRVEPGYNKTDRKLVLISGTAMFKVAHVADRPFVVEMGDVSIKDIGTWFTITRSADSIKVLVWEGKVAFVDDKTGETRELTEGREESFYVAERRFGEAGIRHYQLRFDDQSLDAVAAGLEKQFGRKIRLSDTVMAQKRLTIHLNGETFEDAIKTVCASLNLEYRVENGVYILKSKE